MAHTINIQEIFREADSFVIASKAIVLKASDYMPFNPLACIAVTYTAYVNHAFAFELYLKCLTVIEGKNIIFGHKLFDFFEGLSEETKAKIKNHFAINNPNHRIAHDVIFGINKTTDIVGLIKHIQQPFKEFRYLYEENKGNQQYELEEAINSVRAIILELKPEFIGYL